MYMYIPDVSTPSAQGGYKSAARTGAAAKRFGSSVRDLTGPLNVEYVDTVSIGQLFASQCSTLIDGVFE